MEATAAITRTNGCLLYTSVYDAEDPYGRVHEERTIKAEPVVQVYERLGYNEDERVAAGRGYASRYPSSPATQHTNF